jgi:hypothetical protein
LYPPIYQRGARPILVVHRPDRPDTVQVFVIEPPIEQPRPVGALRRFQPGNVIADQHG